MNMINTSFLNKELKEAFKTSRLLIIGALFVFFALLSPVTARYMNELLAMLSPDLNLVFPDPVVTDAWGQFFKNTTSLCLIVYMIIMSGTVASEKSKGSILLVLTKKVSRFNFVFSKFVGGVIIFTTVYVISALLSGLYTYILFDKIFYPNLVISIVLIWQMGIFFTAIAILSSVIAKSPTTAALLSFVGFGVLSILTVIPSFVKFNPAGASSIVNNIMAQTASTQSIWINLVSSVLCTIGLIFLSHQIFKKQEL